MYKSILNLKNASLANSNGDTMKKAETGWTIADGLVRVIPTAQNTYRVSKEALTTTPVFYKVTPEFIVFSDNWKDLAENMTPCASYFYDYLLYQAPLTPQTAASDVCLLRGGETIEIDGFGNVKTIDLTPIPPSPPLTPDVFREKLQSQLTALDGADPVFHLSAGLDSSLLVLMAKDLFTRSPLVAASCKTLGRGAAQELDIAQKVADFVGATYHIFNFEDVDIFQAGEDYITHGPGYPCVHPSHLVRFLMDREISKKGFKTIVTGRGPDETLAGYAWHTDAFSDPGAHNDRIRASDHDIIRALFKNDARGKAEDNYHAYFTRGYSMNDRMGYDLLTLFDHWNVIDRGLADSFSLDYKLPFTDKTITAGLLALPDELTAHRGALRKPFMIDCFRDIYPDFLIDVPKFGLTLDCGAYFARYSHEDIMRRIYHDSVYNAEHLDQGIVSDMIEKTLSGAQNFGWQLWGLHLMARTVEHSLKPHLTQGQRHEEELHRHRHAAGRNNISVS